MTDAIESLYDPNYGDGTFGDVYFGGTAPEPATDQWPYNVVRPHEDAVADILQAVEVTLAQFDGDVGDVFEQRFIDSASGESLDRLAREVGVTQSQNEGRDHFRERARLRKFIASTRCTTPAFEQVLAQLFDDPTQISIESTGDTPVVTVKIPSTVLDDHAFTESTITDILEDALPAGDGVELLTGDTFILGESGQQGLSNGGLI